MATETNKAPSKKVFKSIAQKVSDKRTMQNVETQTFTIDAAGRPLGRVASEAASALLGKNSTNYVRNFVIPTQVTITNASKLAIAEKKMLQKEYDHYTGHVAGRRVITLGKLAEKKGLEEVLRRAVDGMIPRNKLRKERMKRLTITA
jgi:large subunit ribosomal protein L13